MYKDFNECEKQLADLMSRISEEGYAAGWMKYLEFDIWNAMYGGDRKYARYAITDEDVEQLSALSKACGCWIYFDNIKEETAINMEDWKLKFAAHWEDGPAKR